MKSVFKWVGIVLGVLIILLLIIGFSLLINGKSKAAGPYTVEHPFEAGRADSVLIARGQHLATAVSRCTGCHGEDLSGFLMVDDKAFGVISAPNLTSGSGGIGGLYSDADFERAVRHGVGKDGRALVAMPSEYFAEMTDDDLKALIAYLRQVPDVDTELPERDLGPVAHLFLGAGMFKPPAIALDHARDHVRSVNDELSTSYGKYLVAVAACGECHGPRMKGPEFEGPPPGPDITSTGASASWTEEEFIFALRSGSTPDGRILDGQIMPWPRFSRMTDAEIQAIWAYLQTL